MNGADLVGGEVLVVGGFETESDSGLIAGVDTKLCSGSAPGQLLVRDLVVASILDNVVEDLQEVEVRISDLRLGVKFRAAFGVEGFEVIDKLLIFGGAIDGVLWDGLLRRHRYRSARAGRAQMLYNCASSVKRVHLSSLRFKLRGRGGKFVVLKIVVGYTPQWPECFVATRWIQIDMNVSRWWWQSQSIRWLG